MNTRDCVTHYMISSFLQEGSVLNLTSNGKAAKLSDAKLGHHLQEGQVDNALKVRHAWTVTGIIRY